MGRRDYKYIPVNCTLGINQQDEKIRPGQCFDARNFWAPNGRLETRPGYVGLTSMINVPTTVTVFSARTEDVSAGTFASPSGAGILTLNNLVGRVASGGDQDRWYIGFTSAFSGLTILVATTNANATQFKAEYWNGSIWTYLHVVEYNAASRAGSHLASTNISFLFAAPQDWAATTVDSLSRFWLRFNLLTANIDADTTVDVDDVSTVRHGASDIRGMAVMQFPSTRRYLTVERQSATSLAIRSAASLFIDPPHSGLSASGSFATEEPAMVATIPQFNEAFLTYDWRTFRIPVPSATGSDPPENATVETDPNFVGTGAYYDTTLVAQESTFPQAKYIMFFKGMLWAANLLGFPHQVRWSGPAPYHKVWPSIQTEALMENDNSPISGLSALGEHPVVFKNDSIWNMVFSGIDAFNLTTFTPTKMVTGVGCVSNSSIKEIRGRLVFLAEDGIYAFDGTPNIRKVTLDPKTGADRLKTTIASINPGRRPFSVAAHWRKHSLYLLSVATAGSNANNLVIVWDYLNDAWWLWNNIEAQFWLEDEDSFDNETLYFGDSSGRVYQMGVGQTDHGVAITATLTSGRLANVGVTTTLRTINVDASPGTRSLSIIARPEDRQLDQVTGTLDTTDPNEDDWSTLQWGTTSPDNWLPPSKRSLRLDFRKTAAWHRLLLSHSTRNQKADISSIDIGFVPIGRR